MKHFATLVVCLLASVCVAYAQEQKAEITFEKYIHDFGTIYEANGAVTCTFKYTNTGNANLVIHQAVASCGCTQPTYSKEPLAPGESAELSVTYNGTGKTPGPFVKSVTLRTNGKNEIIRLSVKGTMIAKEKGDASNATEE